MPGYLYHLSFAEEVYKKLPQTIKLDKLDFMAGNLIPDLATNKKDSHYRKDATLHGFFVPELTDVKKDLYNPNNSILLGMYSHLYLDYYFIESFLIPEFLWDAEKMLVTNPRNNKQWDIKTFFSNDGMYGAYTSINHLLINDNKVSKQLLDSLPEILPNTGLLLFDTRRDTTWKKELTKYLNENKEYTGDIFDYNRLWNHIEKIADQFISEITN